MIHLSGLTFSITPDEALVETRQKLVIRENFGSILRKLRPFLVYIDKINRMRNLHDKIYILIYVKNGKYDNNQQS